MVRNPQFNFKEGFCWTDINSTFLKARLKGNGVFDVVTMSLFSKTHLPDWYFVCLINTKLISFYVDNFINNTSHFQINDARQLPIIIPTENQLSEMKGIFNNAYRIKQAQFSGNYSLVKVEDMLNSIQNQLDKYISRLYRTI